MGQYSEFVARVAADKIKQTVSLLEESGSIREIRVFEELSLIIGLVKSDRDRGAFCTLLECGIDDFRMMGQAGSEADDYPLNADTFAD